MAADTFTLPRTRHRREVRTRPYTAILPKVLAAAPVLIILAAQAFLTVRMLTWAYASGDEGRYIYAGHQLIYEFWHGGGSPYFETSFSGAPVIFPVIAAMADHMGGLAAVRTLSLTFMLVATFMLFLGTRRLFGYLPAVVAAAIFAGVGLTQDIGALGTYDAMSTMWVTVAAYCAVRTGVMERHPVAWLFSVPVALFLANATKYVTVLFDPVVIALAALQVSGFGWRRVRERVIALGLATSLILAVTLFLAGGAYLKGVLFSTLARSGGTSAVFVGTSLSDKVIISESWSWIGVTVAGSAAGLLLTLAERSRREFMHSVLFLFAGCLVTLGNLRLHTDESMYKHDDLAAWFACMGTGAALTVLIRNSNRFAKWAVAIASIAAVVLSGVHYSKTAISTYQAGDNKMTLVGAAALKPYLQLPAGRYLIGGLTSDQTIYINHVAVPWFRLSDDTYIKYPIPGRGGDPHGQTPGLTCGDAGQPPTTTSGCVYLQGAAGYVAAIRAHYFALISMLGNHGAEFSNDHAILTTVKSTPGYVLLTTAGGAPTFIYAPDYPAWARAHQEQAREARPQVQRGALRHRAGRGCTPVRHCKSLLENWVGAVDRNAW